MVSSPRRAAAPPALEHGIYDEVKSYRPGNFTDSKTTRGCPVRGSRDPLGLAGGGALPYEGARHCPGFSRRGEQHGVWGLGFRVQGLNEGFNTRNPKLQTRGTELNPLARVQTPSQSPNP